jgi:uncharacterized protein YegP (UPF0339 family)
MRAYVLEIYEDQSQQLRWSLKTRGRVVADSGEAYKTMKAFLDTLDTMCALLLRREGYRIVASPELRNRLNASILRRKLSVPMIVER